MRTWKIVAPLALAGALWIQAAPAAAHGHGVCRDDVKRLCGDAQYSHGGIAACLDQHAADLSPDCQERVTKRKAHIQQFQEACGADVQKLCANADRGPLTFRCLHDHGADLSATCKDELAAAQTRHHQWRHHGETAPPAEDSSGS